MSLPKDPTKIEDYKKKMSSSKIKYLTPEDRKNARKERSLINILAIRKNRMDWAKDNPEKVKNTILKRKYKITLDRYNELYIKQGGVCAVCFERETMKYLGKVRVLCVEHDHKTGKVRGLLCSNCNRALGLLQDSPVVVNSLKEYLINNNQTI